MRIHITLSLTLGLLLSSCDDPNAAKAKVLENEITQLQRKIIESQQSAKRLEVQVNAAKAERQKLEGEKEKASQEKSKTEEELNRLKEEFNAYKAKYKVSMQRQVPGLELGPVVASGISYSKITVTEWTPMLLKFQHSGGLGSVALADLAENLKDQLGISAAHEPIELASEAAVAKLSRNELRRNYKVDKLSLDEQLSELSANILETGKRLEQAQINQTMAIEQKLPRSAKLDNAVSQLQLRLDQLKAQRTLLQVEKDTKAIELTVDLKTAED
jgi:hypothetical protein